MLFGNGRCTPNCRQIRIQLASYLKSIRFSVVISDLSTNLEAMWLRLRWRPIFFKSRRLTAILPFEPSMIVGTRNAPFWGDWHPPEIKLTRSTKGMATSTLQGFVQNDTEISPLQFTFWRVSICILEAEIVLGALYRKRGTPKKGVTLGFPHISQFCNLLAKVDR